MVSARYADIGKKGTARKEKPAGQNMDQRIHKNKVIFHPELRHRSLSHTNQPKAKTRAMARVRRASSDVDQLTVRRV